MPCDRRPLKTLKKVSTVTTYITLALTVVDLPPTQHLICLIVPIIIHHHGGPSQRLQRLLGGLCRVRKPNQDAPSSVQAASLAEQHCDVVGVILQRHVESLRQDGSGKQQQ